MKIPKKLLNYKKTKVLFEGELDREVAKKTS